MPSEILVSTIDDIRAESVRVLHIDRRRDHDEDVRLALEHLECIDKVNVVLDVCLLVPVLWPRVIRPEHDDDDGRPSLQCRLELGLDPVRHGALSQDGAAAQPVVAHFVLGVVDVI